MLGIKLVYECPECGNIMTVNAAFGTRRQRVAACSDVPEACSCGRKTGFAVIDFEKIFLKVESKEEN